MGRPSGWEAPGAASAGISHFADCGSTGGAGFAAAAGLESASGTGPPAAAGAAAAASTLASRIGSPGHHRWRSGSGVDVRDSPPRRSRCPAGRNDRDAPVHLRPVEPGPRGDGGLGLGQGRGEPIATPRPLAQRVAVGRIAAAAAGPPGRSRSPASAPVAPGAELLLLCLGVAQEFQRAFILLVLEIIQPVAHQVPRPAGTGRPRRATRAPSTTSPTRRTRPVAPHPRWVAAGPGRSRRSSRPPASPRSIPTLCDARQASLLLVIGHCHWSLMRPVPSGTRHRSLATMTEDGPAPARVGVSLNRPRPSHGARVVTMTNDQ